MKAAGKRSQSFVEMIDFYRTLSALAGLTEPPSYVQGASLRPILDDVSASVRPNAFTQLINGYTLRTRDFRFSQWKTDDPFDIEFYDLRKDPEEMVNLAKDPKYAAQIRRLKALLAKRIADVTELPEGLKFIPPEPGDRGVSKVDSYF